MAAQGSGALRPWRVAGAAPVNACPPWLNRSMSNDSWRAEECAEALIMDPAVMKYLDVNGYRDFKFSYFLKDDGVRALARVCRLDLEKGLSENLNLKRRNAEWRRSWNAACSVMPPKRTQRGGDAPPAAAPS